MSAIVPVYRAESLTIYQDDCREVMATLADDSIDSIVTDPPYGLEFMGKEWDRFTPGEAPMTATQRSDHMNRSEPYGPWGRGDRPVAPNDYGHRNERCLACGKWRISSNRCQCAEPQFEYRIRQSAPPSMLAYQQWCTGWARECLRVLRPGGHMVAFGGTRTYHRLTCAIEDAGFEIRDSLHWIYGSGFPKSLDVSKAIDRAAGAGRAVIREGAPLRRMIPGADQNATGSWIKDNGREFVPAVTEPATEDAACWDGWGTALKPACEPIVLARKPLAGTVAANVLAHGTGALNINGCRVGHASEADRAESEGKNQHTRYDNHSDRLGAHGIYGEAGTERPDYDGSAGRWPPNALLTHSADCQPAGTRRVSCGGSGLGHGGLGGGGHGDAGGTELTRARDCAPGCPVAALDGQSGTSQSGVRKGGEGELYDQSAGSWRFRRAPGGFTDSGGASRFFPQFAWSPEHDIPFMYQAKAPRSERPRLPDGTAHPTVKPLSLMSWLVRLVTPPGGLALDPFAGTGTTGQAAVPGGFRAVLIEESADYAEMIFRRLGLS